MRNAARIQRAHWAAYRAHRAFVSSLSRDEYLSMMRDLLAGWNRTEIAADMRRNGHGDGMVEIGLTALFADTPNAKRLPGRKRHQG